MTTDVDVIVPAHDEEHLLPRCLLSVLTMSEPLRLRVVVVANGCTDRTADVARSFHEIASGHGHELVLVELERAGKSHALNAGDAHRRGGPVVYLDADTVLLPHSLPALGERLSGAGPTLAAPPPVLVRPRSRMSRDFGAIWRLLPNVRADVVGAGCYGVSAAGRERWGPFPDVVADDLYVRSRFAPDERAVTATGGFFLVLPEGLELLPVLRRWRLGNQQLAALGQSTLRTTWRGRLPRLPRRAWRHLPGFVVATLGWRLGAPALGDPAHWARAHSSRAGAQRPADFSAGRRVTVIVVTHNNNEQVDACLGSIRSSAAHLDVVVVDNASSDATARRVAAGFPEVRLVVNPRNEGFARAVNQAAGMASGSHLLLVNPDAVLSDDAVDELLALAVRFPDAGLYGGRELDASGRLVRASCLARPSMWQALAFSLGLSALPGGAALEPDALGGWDRDDVRPVPALAGSLLLVDRALWQELGGFDETFVLYGEDVDLCVRAARLGARPMFTPRASYRHEGGGSSNAQLRQELILRGKVTLLRKHLPPWQRPLAATALLLGTGARAAVERVTGARGARAHSWLEIWRARERWQAGWRPGEDVPGPVAGSLRTDVTG